MKKIFVTGAAGFIGFHLIQKLIMRGDTVVGIDNFNDYYDPFLKEKRALELKKIGVDVLKIDICDQITLKNLLKNEKPDVIVHLAAQAGVRYSLENPQAYIKANIEGFVNILENCRELSGTPLIYASSSSVYGLNENVPFSVEDRTDRQASLYGATKKSNELFASTYHHLFKIPVTGLRFFTVYGPWGRPDMAYYQFTKDILAGNPIKIFNHGQMKRDFTYVDDIVDGIVAVVDKPFANEIFNLGNHKSEALLKMVETLEKLLGKEANKVFMSMQPGDVVETYADIEKSQRLLNYQPKTSLEDGLKKFIDWYLI